MNMKTSRNILILLIATGIAFAVGCKHHADPTGDITNNGNNNPPPTPWANPDPCDPDSVYYYPTISTMLNNYCGTANCHDVVSHKGGINVSTYTSVINENGFVVSGHASQSDVYQVLFEGDDDHMPPYDHAQMTSDQIVQLQQWINQGAHNNECTPDCDTTYAPTFSGVILPMIENNCGGCHGTSNPSANLPLTNYAQIAANANSGNLINSLKATDGFSMMPENTTGLPQCMIDQMQEWIDLGTPNN